jgi:UDP-N-acetylglucosamine--N-acetylmuramyl-(pentapeptide) pyrophosphoryl-undecaprenol N-acetylglucosamine transferase
MKFLIVAAKTGGHVFPAATVSKKLINKDHQIILIGTGNNIEINAYEDLNSKQYKPNVSTFSRPHTT